LRRLKIEYEIYFNGNAKNPPRDTLFRVDAVVKKFANEAVALSLGQRFKFNQLVQRYAVQSDLWRRRLRTKEEGAAPLGAVTRPTSPPRALASIVLGDPASETAKLGQVVEALIAAEKRAGRPAGVPAEVLDPLAMADEVFDHIQQVKASTGAERVRVSVRLRDGQVELDVTPD
ncbi:MAG TPA: hypothetical protein VKU44_05150, partial [Terriglobia bacterium]|nr:hypothetical protein [Terriglobia bacterium]